MWKNYNNNNNNEEEEEEEAEEIALEVGVYAIPCNMFDKFLNR